MNGRRPDRALLVGVLVLLLVVLLFLLITRCRPGFFGAVAPTL